MSANVLTVLTQKSCAMLPVKHIALMFIVDFLSVRMAKSLAGEQSDARASDAIVPNLLSSCHFSVHPIR
jgi:hypothetical protein